MEFCPESAVQVHDFAHEGFARPGGEGAPVALGVLPQDFDQIEFQTVGRQVQGCEAVFDQAALDDCGLYVVMDRGVVHDNEGELRAVAGLGDTVQECDDIVAPHAVLADAEVKVFRGVVERSQDIGSLAVPRWHRRCGACPEATSCAAHWADMRNRLRRSTATRSRPPGRLAAVGPARSLLARIRQQNVFLSDRRVRLKLKLRALRPIDKRSKVNSGASGKRSLTRAAILPRVRGCSAAICAATSSISAVSLTGGPPL